MIPAAARVVLLGAGLAFASAAAAAPKPCNTCEDLCQLIDQYQQKEKQIELYQRYAGPRPTAHPRAGEGAGDAVEREFNEWNLRMTAALCGAACAEPR